MVKYQIGILPHIQPDDPIYDSVDEAVYQAEILSENQSEDNVAIGIWELEDDGEPTLKGVIVDSERFLATSEINALMWDKDNELGDLEQRMSELENQIDERAWHKSQYQEKLAWLEETYFIPEDLCLADQLAIQKAIMDVLGVKSTWAINT